jgi:hypothetical protein
VKANAVWIEPDSLAVATRDDETDARSGLERAADWAQIGMLAATVVAVLVAWFQIQGAKRQGRSQRTGQVFDRLNNRDFHIRWSKILTFLKVDGEEECLGRIRREVRVPTGNDPLLPLEGSDSVVLNDIQAAHGLFEEAALLFNDHTLEQDTVIRAFGDSIADAYLSSWWWIHYQRECRDRSIAARWVRKREATAYSEWERMVRTMIDQSPASRADFEAAWGPSPVVPSVFRSTTRRRTASGWRPACCRRLSARCSDGRAATTTSRTSSARSSPPGDTSRSRSRPSTGPFSSHHGRSCSRSRHARVARR